VLDPSTPGFNYETLGRITRSNVVRGNHTVYDRGVTRADFNESVFDRQQQQQQQQQRTTEPRSQHHKQRDDLSTLRSETLYYAPAL